MIDQGTFAAVGEALLACSRIILGILGIFGKFFCMRPPMIDSDLFYMGVMMACDIFLARRLISYTGTRYTTVDFVINKKSRKREFESVHY